MSWGAIAAGAMVALAVFVLLTLLGVALGIEVVVRGATENFGAGAAIYSIVTLMLAMFFGGWATSRLAVGESKLEAVLYGVILWGLLFAGLLWLVSSGVRTGFSAVVGTATGAYGGGGQGGSAAGAQPVDPADIEKNLGVSRETAQQFSEYVNRLQSSPGQTVREAVSQTGVQQTSRQAAWWSLGGVVLSMVTVILGSLMGSGDLPVPVPILGVRRPTARDPRA
ncbi:MAG TPA: hypothetical protein VF590_00090 [Isosphaeraceae bacterium]